MEVTRANFKEALAEIEVLLPQAAFISFDTEFTGIGNDSANNLKQTPFDSLEERYHWKQYNTRFYSVIQFGLTIFLYTPETHSYSIHPYNFHVYNHQTPINFSGEPRTLQFLAEHGFDFSYLFKNGIPYMTAEKEDAFRQKLESELSRKAATLQRLYDMDSKSGSSPESSNLNSLPSAALKHHRDRLNQQSMKLEDLAFLGQTSGFLKQFLTNDEKKELVFEESNNWKRRMIYDCVNYQFQGKFHAIKNGDKLTIRKLKKDGQTGGYTIEEMLQFEKERIESSLSHELGITQLIRLLCKSQNIIVGHNTHMDWIYITRQFIQPLDKTTFKEFQEIFSRNFPRHIDVKILANTAGQLKDIINLKHTDVASLFKRVLLDPFNFRAPKFYFGENHVKIASSLKDFEEGGKGSLHNAMFDALLTGKTFALLANVLMTMEFRGKNAQLDIRNSQVLGYFYGKVFVYGIQDVLWQDLVNDDINKANMAAVDKSHVFHVTFPREWRENDLQEIFREAAGKIDIRWLNDWSALVACKDRSRAIDVVNKMVNFPLNSGVYKVQTYREYEAYRRRERCGYVPTAKDVGLGVLDPSTYTGGTTYYHHTPPVHHYTNLTPQAEPFQPGNRTWKRQQPSSRSTTPTSSIIAAHQNGKATRRGSISNPIPDKRRKQTPATVTTRSKSDRSLSDQTGETIDHVEACITGKTKSADDKKARNVSGSSCSADSATSSGTSDPLEKPAVVVAVKTELEDGEYVSDDEKTKTGTKPKEIKDNSQA